MLEDDITGRSCFGATPCLVFDAIGEGEFRAKSENALAELAITRLDPQRISKNAVQHTVPSAKCLQNESHAHPQPQSPFPPARTKAEPRAGPSPMLKLPQERTLMNPPNPPKTKNTKRTHQPHPSPTFQNHYTSPNEPMVDPAASPASMKVIHSRRTSLN